MQVVHLKICHDFYSVHSSLFLQPRQVNRQTLQTLSCLETWSDIHSRFISCILYTIQSQRIKVSLQVHQQTLSDCLWQVQNRQPIGRKIFSHHSNINSRCSGCCSKSNISKWDESQITLWYLSYTQQMFCYFQWRIHDTCLFYYLQTEEQTWSWWAHTKI